MSNGKLPFTIHGDDSIWASGPWSWAGKVVRYVGSGEETRRGGSLPHASRDLVKGKEYRATIKRVIHDGDGLVMLEVHDKEGVVVFAADSMTVHERRPAEGEWGWLKDREEKN